MKILFLTEKLYGGGLPRRMILFSEILKNKNLDVIVVGKKGDLINILKSKKIKYYTLIKRFSNRFLNLIFYPVDIIFLAYIIQKEKITTISNHCRYTMPMAYILSKLFKLKYINVDHGIKKTMPLFKIKSLWGENILSVSNGAAEELTNSYKIDKKNITVIRNTIPPLKMTAKSDISYNGEKKIVTCIALFNEAKNHEFLLNAWKIVVKKNQNNILYLMGRGKFKTKLKELIIKNNIEEYVKFIPSNSNVQEIINQSSFLVLTSIREGLPTVILESFSLCKTVIASNIPGTNEIVQHGVNGLLYTPDDINDFVKHTLDLLSDTNKTEYLGKNALDTYNKNFSYESYKKNIFAFYKK